MRDFVEYLDEIVEPTVADFEANPTSRRHAFLACVATCHAVDYLIYPRKATGTRQKFEKTRRDFKTVDEIGHAFKHVTTGAGPEACRKATDVISRPPGTVGNFAVGLSRIGDGVGGVTPSTETSEDILKALRCALAFLRR